MLSIQHLLIVGKQGGIAARVSTGLKQVAKISDPIDYLH